ncbi:ECF-type sigma factor, partial [Singulisphaera rosea]
MSTNFTELLARVRAGDGQAAGELVRKYEPVIRVTIRAKLQDARLRRVVDSMDLCQSVMANFFSRAAFGEFDLEAPDQLVGLLVTMAKNK